MSNDFSSLDRLMELGLSMAVAQQMMNTMNHALNTMQTPGCDRPVRRDEIKYYAVVEGRQAGPFSETEMEMLVKNGRLQNDTLIWKSGMNGWKYAGEVCEINKYFLLYPSDKK